MNPFTFTSPTDKMPGAWHGSYCDAYNRLFRPLKETTGDILELGVDGGGSLLAYADYFKNADHLVGMDIQARPASLDGQDRILFYQGDAYSEYQRLQCNESTFAVLVDDGPHTIGSQIFFVQKYVPFLLPDGIAIIEDVQSPDYIAQLYANLPVGFIGYSVDLRLADNRYDSLLFVIERR